MEMWVSLMCLKGDCLLDLKRFSEAEACFEEVFRQANDPVALSSRGYSRWALGRLKEAKEDYLHAITLPGDSENREILFRMLAELCLEMNDPGEADAFLECARKISGDSEEIEAVQKEIRAARER
jgi:tetratricopeptide (TPR) repeat protein